MDRIGRILFVQDVHRSHLKVFNQHAITLVIGVGFDTETQIQATEVIIGQVGLEAAADAALREDEGRLPVKTVCR